jgi:BlaI family transcriptional regulator, penicillinase repressor
MDHDKTPTSAELEILNLLWEKHPQTVKEIHETLMDKKGVGYTTTLKIMQNMFDKGILRREPNGKSHLYYPLLKKEETRGKLLDTFLETTFGGSAANLVMQLLGNQKATREELDKIKSLIDQIEKSK